MEVIFYKYATIQCTDSGVFLFMDNEIEVPTMGKCTWLRQFDPGQRNEAFSFAIRWTLVKVSEIILSVNGKKQIRLLYIRDPEDKTRPYKSRFW
ncbi:hypothetical protein [Desulfobotulus alkaliphilus]|uniref:hypothetical protein n=1 Tax=Desulfobotulus alkaliphilus TaxID=622671 RepID=UPI001C97D64E|nr:hypothetical protein [Desulfobotulus alkaliphilus]